MLIKMSLIGISSLILILSCTKESVSGPSYNFKKATKEGIAAKANDIEITFAEINDGIENEIYELEKKIFDAKMAKLKTVLLEKLMEKDPKKKGLSNDEFLEKYVAAKVKVSDKEVDAFVLEKSIPMDRVTPQLKERIKEFLMADKKKEALDNWIAKKAKSIDVFLKKPRRPVFDVEIGKAPQTNPKAKVTVVEFSDFQCPYCSQAAKTINEVKKKYGSKVNIVFKQFPLPFHNQAIPAANAALCAHEQKPEYFWKMHDAMFADQTKLSKEGLRATAKKIGVKEKEFEKCLEENRYKSQIDKEMDQGKKLGVKSTPTFFVQGKLVTGAQPISVFSELIDEELAKK